MKTMAIRFHPLSVARFLRQAAMIAAWASIRLSAVGADVPASTAPANDQDVFSAFEQLLQMKVTTATRRATPLHQTAAAVTVLTGEDILRTGAVTLPDALRYVPGMDVDRINSLTYGVGARGFGGQYANQLLVMIDGRSIYNPAFGGVFWIRNNPFFEDLDRIEVVRGPGGALWGANAVNGVINIISKDARDTQGTLVYAGGGDFEEIMAGARQGFQLSERTFGRIYIKHLEVDSIFRPGDAVADPWSITQAGFRIDHHPDNTTRLTLQGDVVAAPNHNANFIPNATAPDYGKVVVFPIKYNGANVLGRWTRDTAAGATLMLQGYWNYAENAQAVFLERQHTFDFELQHNTTLGDRHALTSGVGYRLVSEHIAPSVILRAPGPESTADQVFSASVQDEIALMTRTLFLTVGSKLEHNDYSGWEIQPNIRLRWQPEETQMVWAAVSRAVATPNRLNTGIELDVRMLPPGALGAGSPATLAQAQGAVDRSEKMFAYELGYRLQPTRRTSIDVAVFFNRYSDLQITRTGSPDFNATPPVLPIYWTNGPSGSTWGAEFSARWEPLATSDWQLQASYTYFRSDVQQPSLGRDAGGGSPRHKATLRSTVHLGRHWEWDAGLRFVDQLAALNIPRYLELDLRLAWKPNHHWEFALVGQNLLHDRHPEHPPGVNIPLAEVPRSVYGKVMWKF